jgi:hypothetical protein
MAVLLDPGLLAGRPMAITGTGGAPSNSLKLGVS